MTRVVTILGWELKSLTQLQKAFNSPTVKSFSELLKVAGLEVYHFSDRSVIGWRLEQGFTSSSFSKSSRAVSDEDRGRYEMITEVECGQVIHVMIKVIGEPSIIEMQV